MAALAGYASQPGGGTIHTTTAGRFPSNSVSACIQGLLLAERVCDISDRDHLAVVGVFFVAGGRADREIQGPTGIDGRSKCGQSRAGERRSTATKHASTTGTANS